MKFTGKNKDFVAYWNCECQCYTIYYKGNVFAIKYRFREVKTYLN